MRIRKPHVPKDKIIKELHKLEEQAKQLLEKYPEDADLKALARESRELRETLEKGEFNFKMRHIVGKKRALRKLARRVEKKYGALMSLDISDI